MTDGVRILTIPRRDPVNAYSMGGIVRDAGLSIKKLATNEWLIGVPYSSSADRYAAAQGRSEPPPSRYRMRRRFGARGPIVASRVVAFLSLMAVVVGQACVEGSLKHVPTDAELGADVEHLAKRLAEEDAFSGVVFLSHRGQPVLRQAFGLADRDERRPNTIDTPFELASVSKMFTAVMVAQLVERNKISLDATIGSLLPGYPPGQARSQVTVRHLLTMSSGIPDLFRSPRFWAGLPDVKTLSDFWSFFATEPLQFSPGTRWSYSNSNFLILGSIIERSEGVPFPAAVQQHVFRPAGMTHTSYQSQAFPERARGYTHTPPGSPPGGRLDPHGWYATSKGSAANGGTAAGSPMGGGVSTASDLARFAEALMSGRLLSREWTKRVLTGYVPTPYGRDGYGFETRAWNGVRIVGHVGGFTGISNQVDFYPDLGYVLVVLGNSDARGTQELADRVRTLIAGSPM